MGVNEKVKGKKQMADEWQFFFFSKPQIIASDSKYLQSAVLVIISQWN